MRISDWSSDVCSSDLAALFTAREILDAPVTGRAAQRLHRDFELIVECPAVDRIDLFLERAHFLHERVEIGVGGRRSEEHTSELQSLMRISYAVFCLKKKINTRKNIQYNIL